MIILCDMDGVLATGPGMDTTPGEPIYRTFTESPEELGRIRAAGIPLHVVTAKVEAEAAQVLEAIELDAHIASVIGADRLFWPSVWAAIRRRRLPANLSKIPSRRLLSEGSGCVVMIEDRREHLRDMLESNGIDFGILVPPLTVADDRIREWFDLNLAFRLARQLVTADVTVDQLNRLDISVRRWQDGGPERSGPGQFSRTLHEGRYLLELPTLSFGESPTDAPTLASLDTGRVLRPGRPTVVTTVRTGRRLIRRIVKRF